MEHTRNAFRNVPGTSPETFPRPFWRRVGTALTGEVVLKTLPPPTPSLQDAQTGNPENREGSK